jgi:DNA-binding CsgD family transcriptional regulator
MTRIPGHRVVDKPVGHLWPQVDDSWVDFLKRALNTRQPIEISGAGLKAQFLMSAFWVDDRRIGVTFIDISAQKASEHALDQARRVLASQVKDQTAELRSANRRLQKEVSARKQAQLGLVKKTEELEIRTIGLEEANAALKVLLKELKSERTILEEQVVCNLNSLIRPHLSAIAAGNLSQRQRSLLRVVNSNLNEIAAPMNRKLLIDGSHLTPVETQVADLIRQAKTTKEIAEILGVAKSTVDFHRLNIRRKLRLTNHRTNLQSYLRALE